MEQESAASLGRRIQNVEAFCCLQPVSLCAINNKKEEWKKEFVLIFPFSAVKSKAVAAFQMSGSCQSHLTVIHPTIPFVPFKTDVSLPPTVFLFTSEAKFISISTICVQNRIHCSS